MRFLVLILIGVMSLALIHNPLMISNISNIKEENSSYNNISQELISAGLYLWETKHIPSNVDIVRHLIYLPFSIIRVKSGLSFTNGFVTDLTNAEFRANIEVQNKNILGDFKAEEVELDSEWLPDHNGSRSIVAVIDTGVDFEHPALDKALYLQKSFHKIEYGYESDEGPEDNEGHGTSVASLVAGFDGTFRGTGYGGKIVNAKIGVENGIITAASLLAALDWSISLSEVDIITMSLGEPEEGPAFDIIEDLVNIGVKEGKIIVSSAGNRGSNSHSPYTIGSPGSSPEAITVGAVDNSNNIASFSSHGPTVRYEAKPDILASGVGIKTANRGGGYRQVSGTSFSTPIVAGAVATVISAFRNQNLNYTPGTIKSILGLSSIDIDYPSYIQGFGKLNLSRAIELIYNSEPLIGPRDPFLPYQQIPAGQDFSFPVSIIHSDIINWDVVSNDTLFGLTQDTYYSGYTTIEDIFIDVPIDLTSGIYPIRLSLAGYSTKFIDFTLNVSSPAEVSILLDYSHTIWDTFIFANNYDHLDRYNGRDLQKSVSYLLDQSVWVEEMLGGELTNELLSGFDVLWMPSAFTKTEPQPYDHPLSRSTSLTQDELIVIEDFLSNSGSIILDLGGTSIYDDEFNSVFVDEESLIALTSLIGIQTKINSSLDSRVYHSINSTPSYVPVTFQLESNLEFLYGIPFFDGENGFGAIGMTTAEQGKIYLHNSRNWRDNSNYFEGSILSPYVDSIYNWVIHKEGLVSLKYIDDGSLKINATFSGLNSSVTPSLMIGGKVPDYEILDIDQSNLLLEVQNYIEGDILELRFNNTEYNFYTTKLLDFNPPQVRIVDYQIYNNRIIINFDFLPQEDIPSLSIFVNTRNLPVSSVRIGSNGSIYQLTIFSDDPDYILDNSQSIIIDYLDLNGNWGSTHLSIPIQLTQSTTDITSSQKRLVENNFTSIFITIFLIATVTKVNRFRKLSD